MAKNQIIAYAQSKLDDARRALHDAVEDFSIPDEKVVELREAARRAFQELKELDRKAAKRGVLGILGF